MNLSYYMKTYGMYSQIKDTLHTYVHTYINIRRTKSIIKNPFLFVCTGTVPFKY